MTFHAVCVLQGLLGLVTLAQVERSWMLAFARWNALRQLKGAKAMKFEQYEYTIGSHFLSALINGDTSGLSDAEEKELDEWLESLGHSDGHWATTDDHDEFGRCDVTDLRSSVETVVYNEVINETT